mmetsp:Transcript_67689/g.190803  ORF Transcript_67689/g.190803 Transcript_67689/m.190803 type:complete len:224 (-) Transcript_67689:169-840(-)
MKRDYDHLFKLVLIGDSGAGKSCLLLRFADDAFTESYITTIGVDFRFKTISVGGRKIKLQIWDTAGQERFRTMTSAFYRGADGIALVYDVTDPASFEQIEDWFNEVNRQSDQGITKILIGNKCDLAPERRVSSAEGGRRARELGMEFIETSAKDATNVEAIFSTVSAELARRRDRQGAPGQGQRAGVGLLTPQTPRRGVGGCAGCAGAGGGASALASTSHSPA